MIDVDYDVAVLGAGAAGLFAAFRAAERGRRVLLLEKNRRPGVKILMSGGTRCNITNARGLKDHSFVSGAIDPAFNPKEARGSRSIMEAFGPNGRFLAPALKALSVEQTVRLFETEGVATKIEGNGKLFPVSDRAVDVLDALVRRLERSGAELRTYCPVREVEAKDDAFLIHLPDGPLRARRVILAVGGQSYPGCGTSGDGYQIARSFGHTIIEPRPALVPLRIEADWIRDLKGITIPDTLARVLVPGGPKLSERREAVLFAHFGLTGPAILDVSGPVARYEGPGSLTLELDFVPDIRLEALDAQLQASARSGRRLVSNLLPEELPRRLTTALMRACSVPDDRVGPELSRDERRRLLAGIKSLRIPIAGTLGFAKAEVTSGGVALDEVDPATLESRVQPGVHLIGELLDLDGRIGGYNFQGAWSTGWLAGDSV
ncbi:BaiN/RdsA family NAD(P)/FAD-dependent oxidoreductase [Tautonia rosea]|uniref:NAD(P)/FAD-dependent oxidoreductase n=1 Tax=Tautonia rosea TaxID=2728037 RepID=UPI0014761940|nr:NAD(P)/FAD-dependent oxidoreductase [Tautonia rosea]